LLQVTFNARQPLQNLSSIVVHEFIVPSQRETRNEKRGEPPAPSPAAVVA
jgi:hypothetical protein